MNKNSAPDTALVELARREQLPASYPEMARRWFTPLAEWLCAARSGGEHCLLVGLNGAQGTGKTTLCEVLELMARQQGFRMATLSLDDFYLERSERARLAETVHPLLITRGVPGTHDTALMQEVLDQLAAGEDVLCPVFDKAADDRLPRSQWRHVTPADIVVLEGWCIGVGAQSAAALAKPVNALEEKEDPDGSWRSFVNERLQAEYSQLFARFDKQVMLRAPSLDCVLEWRRLQEEKLAGRRSGQGVMDAAAVQRFVQHYERLTLHGLQTLPGQVDYLLEVAEDHSIVGATVR